MRKLFILFALFFLGNLYLQAQTNLNIPQELPTNYANKFTFELGSKILIELKEIGKGKYDDKVISIEKIGTFYYLKKMKISSTKIPKKTL